MDVRLSMDADALRLRDLPPVDYLLRQPAIASLLVECSRPELVRCVREILDQRREAIRAGRPADLSLPGLALDIRDRLHVRARPHLRRVVNATGIVLHTGLGRAPLAEEAIEAVAEAAAGYCNLELDLATGARGDRQDHLRELLRELTGAGAALVVNNNAAATYLALNTFARGAGVIVSRGQLVEIGGSYRLHEIIEAGDCRLVEVGATNRTRISDYAAALTSDTPVLLRVHTSNFRVQGFVEAPTLAELVRLKRSRPDAPAIVVDDLGSGLLKPAALGTLAPGWDEPSVRESVAGGADLTLFSGDKLLGGPQAGILLGAPELIERLQSNPLTRALRPDKLTIAALEATLRLYRDPAGLVRRVPALRMLTARLDELEARAQRLADRLADMTAPGAISIAQEESHAGGGALPLVAFATWVVRLKPTDADAGRVAAALLSRDLPIAARVNREAVVFDCRTLSDDDIEQIPPAIAEALESAS